jgi:hypothetical protein
MLIILVTSACSGVARVSVSIAHSPFINIFDRHYRREYFLLAGREAYYFTTRELKLYPAK